MVAYRCVAVALSFLFLASSARADGPFTLPDFSKWWPGGRAADVESTPAPAPDAIIGLPNYRQPAPPQEDPWIVAKFDAGVDHLKNGTRSFFRHTRRVFTLPWDRESDAPPRPATLGNPPLRR